MDTDAATTGREVVVCAPRLPSGVADGAGPVPAGPGGVVSGRVLAADDPDHAAADAAAARADAAQAEADRLAAAARAGADAVAAVADAAVITAAMTRLAGTVTTATGWPTPDRRTVLSACDLAIDGLATIRAGLLVAERDSRTWEGHGDKTFEGWRGRTSKLGRRAATGQIRDADELDVVPDIAAAVTTGLIGLEHAKIIAKLAATGSEIQREAAQSADGQADLLDLATQVTADAFKISVEQWAAHLDPTTLNRNLEAQRAARFVHLTETRAGTYLKGLLDNTTGRKLSQALEAVMGKPSPTDDREPEQRRADALGILADHILTDSATTPGAHVPPQITFIVTEESFRGAQTERDRQRTARNAAAREAAAREAAGAGAGAAGASQDALDLVDTTTVEPAHTADTVDVTHSADTSDVDRVEDDEVSSVPTTVVGYEPATWEDGTPVPATDLAVAMCECELTRVVIDAAGEPTDLGRTQRLFTGVQRRAVIARDRECVWPDCHSPARWAQVHHLDWWDRDAGETSVTRGALACSFHHHEIHRLDLTLTLHTINDPNSSENSRTTAGTSQTVTGGTSKGGTSKNRPRLRGTMARVWYEFRDARGRTFGHPPTIGPNAPTGKTPASGGSGAANSGAANSSGPASNASPASSESPARPTAAPPDELDFTRVVDPNTGAIVPAFWIT